MSRSFNTTLSVLTETSIECVGAVESKPVVTEASIGYVCTGDSELSVTEAM